MGQKALAAPFAPLRIPPSSLDQSLVFGVDFSGAQDAGRRIWIAIGVSAGSCLRVVEARRGEDLPGSGRAPAECLPALVRLIQEHPDAAFGCDFPFALPGALMAEATWDGFALSFGARYPTAEDFYAFCHEAANGRELKRQTDREARTPFAAYNARIYRQTFHGIRDVLAPLVREGAAAIRPMQPWRPGVALVFEICPASILKREGLYHPYKGPDPSLAATRERILASFEERGLVALASEDLRRRILADPGGDALDSVIAALGTRQALDEGADRTDPPGLVHKIEGWVY